MTNLQRLKHLLSYLFEIPVISTYSKYNSSLKVSLHRGRYKLVTYGAIYSFSDLYANFRKSFERLRWDEVEVKNCLVLGLGLASIPDMLTQHFHKDIRFSAVEVDEVVIGLANQYVLKPKGIRVDVFTAEAESFLTWHQGRYDMICSDVFKGDAIPPGLQTIESLAAMAELMTPNGLLFYNRLSRYEADRAKNLVFLEQVFKKVFPEGGYLDVDGNWMFVNRIDVFN